MGFLLSATGKTWAMQENMIVYTARATLVDCSVQVVDTYGFDLVVKMLRVAVVNSFRCLSKTMGTIGQQAQVLLPGVSCDWASTTVLPRSPSNSSYSTTPLPFVSMTRSKSFRSRSEKFGMIAWQGDHSQTWRSTSLKSGSWNKVSPRPDGPLKQCDSPYQWQVYIRYPSIKLTFLCPGNVFPWKRIKYLPTSGGKSQAHRKLLHL